MPVSSALAPFPPEALGAPLALRLYYLLRTITCPFVAIEGYVPPVGDIVDFGCGYGAFARWLALRSPARRIVAVDADARKIRTAASLFRESPVTWLIGDDGDGLPACDAIVMIDVLYMLPPLRQKALLRTCHAALRSGGVLLLKGTADRPAWKVAWTRFQDAVLSRLLHLHPMRETYPVSLGDVVEAGFHVECVPLDRGYPYPHQLLLASR